MGLVQRAFRLGVSLRYPLRLPCEGSRVPTGSLGVAKARQAALCRVLCRRHPLPWDEGTLTRSRKKAGLDHCQDSRRPSSTTSSVHHPQLPQSTPGGLWLVSFCPRLTTRPHSLGRYPWVSVGGEVEAGVLGP